MVLKERTLMEGVLHYISIVLRYKWFVVIFTGVAAIGVIAFCFISIKLPPDKSPLPNIYTAEAVILIQQGNQTDLSTSILSALGIQSTEAKITPGFDMGSLMIQVLQSRTFLDKLIEEFHIDQKYMIGDEIKSRARGLLLGKSDYTYNRNTGSLSISFQDTDPVFARDVTNRMVKLLNEWFAQNMGNSTESEKKLLEEKVNEVNAEVGRLEGRLKELQKKYGVLTAQDLGTSQASALAELRSQLIMKEIEIKNYSNISAIEDPKLQQLKEERQNILDLIDEQIQYGSANSNNAATNSGSAKSLPDIQLDFNHLSMELDVQRKIYNTLSHQFEVLQLTSEPKTAFQVLELAEIPDIKSGPSRMVLIVEVVMAAFLISVALSFLFNSITQTRMLKKSREEAKHAG